MLPIATYNAAKEVRISSGVIKGHHNARRPCAFGRNVNFRCAWRDQKYWGRSNLPDLSRALQVGFHGISRKERITGFWHRSRQSTLIRCGLAGSHSIRSGHITIACCAEVACATFLCVGTQEIGQYIPCSCDVAIVFFKLLRIKCQQTACAFFVVSVPT